MLIIKKGFSHLPLKTHTNIDVQQDQKLARDTKLIMQVCWFKTLHDLKPIARYNANCHRCTFIVDIPKASNVEPANDVK